MADRAASSAPSRAAHGGRRRLLVWLVVLILIAGVATAVGLGVLVRQGRIGSAYLPKSSIDGLTSSVERVAGLPVTVACPNGIPLQAGLATGCSVTDGTVTRTLRITQTDDTGTLSWTILE